MLKLSITATGLLLAFTLAAQQQPVTLKQLLESALQHNQSLEVSRYEQELTEQKIVQTRAKTLPSVTGSGNVADNFKRQVIVLPAGAFPSADGSVSSSPTALVAGTPYSSSLGVEASQPLFDMAAFTGLKAAQAGREYSRLSTRQSEEEVISQVAQSYYNILASWETIRLQDSTILNLQKLVTVSQGQYTNGLARKLDLDRLKVNLINAQSQRTQALNQLTTQTNQLKVLLGVPFETSLALANVAFEKLEQQVANTALPEEFDVNNKTEIKLIDSQLRLSELQRKATRAENYPRLSAYLSYNYNVMTSQLGETFTGSGNAITYGMGSFGLRLSVPIFSGLDRYSRAKQNSIQIRQLEKQREASLLSANASFSNARIQMSNSLETLKSQNENVKLATEVYASSQSNYNLGIGSLTDLLDAQNSFTEAKNIYTRELLNYKLAELETLRSTGTVRNLLNEN
jgi:outer membrane protein